VGSYASSCSGAADANYEIGYNTGTVTVVKAATTVSLGSSADPAAYGSTVKIIATVTPAFSGSPTGKVTFSDGTNVLGTGYLSTSGGVTAAALTTSGLSRGAHSITASYAGDGSFNSSSTSTAMIQYVDTSLSGYPTLPNGAVNLSNANLKGAYLGGAALSNAQLTSANFTNAVFLAAVLAHANLSNSNFTSAVFTNANLTAANLTAAILKSASFGGANLAGANLSRVNLAGATGLTSANLSNAIWSNTECPDGTLSNSDGGTCLGHLAP
jgi:hypothetical protein